MLTRCPFAAVCDALGLPPWEHLHFRKVPEVSLCCTSVKILPALFFFPKKPCQMDKADEEGRETIEN